MNRRDPRQSPNKQLVPLVRQDYITKAGGLFESQFMPGCRTADLSSIHPANQSTTGDSRLEFSKFLAGTGRKNSSRLDQNELRKREVFPTTDIKEHHERIGQKMLDRTFQDKLGSRRENSSSLDLVAHTRSGDLPKHFERQTANSGHREYIRDSVEYGVDSQIQDESSEEREIDISTYIKEQRKLIKRVKSGRKLPLHTALKDSSVHYEIKEFKRPRLDSKKDPYISIPNGKGETFTEALDDTQDKFLRQFNTTGSKYDQERLSAKMVQSPILKSNTQHLTQHFKTYDDRGSNNYGDADMDLANLKQRLQLGKSNREMLYGPKEETLGSRFVRRIHIDPAGPSETRKLDDSEPLAKYYRAEDSEDNTQASIGNRYSKPIPSSKGRQL